MEQGGGRPPTPASTQTTGSFATAFAHTPRLVSGTNHPVQELGISRQQEDRASASVPQKTEEETRHAASFASTDGSAYVCWQCRTYGHAIYACSFLSPEQQRFTAFRNYKHQMETRLGMRNLLQQSAREDRFSPQGYPGRSGGGACFSPRGGRYRRSELDQRDRGEFRQAETRYPHRDGRGDRDRSRLPPGVQNAIMYLHNWAEDARALPSREREGEMAPAAPQILQRTDVVNQGLEVSEYVDEDARPGWARDA